MHRRGESVEEQRRLNYHSLFDPGSAAIQFPLKGRYLAQELNDDFDEQIRHIIHFQLLWRPSLVVRHLDLFNNIPLMRFMRSNDAERMRLQGMLDVIAPDDRPFMELFSSWAFGREGQHFHHLDPIEQKLYDELCGRTRGPTLEVAARHLQFDRFGLDLLSRLRSYERLFEGHREILKWSPPAEGYAVQVLATWETLLQDATTASRYSAANLRKVDAIIRNGAAKGWRRKAFFTALEALEPRGGGTSPARLETEQFSMAKLLRDVKLIALNSPFYEELQALRYEEKRPYAPIWVTRDLSAISHSQSSDSNTDYHQDAPALRVEAQPFYRVPLRHIIRWHSPEPINPEFSAFRESVRKVDRVLNEIGGPLPVTELYTMINNHVEVMNACVRRTCTEEGMSLDHETTILQAFAPRSGAAVLTAAASVLSLLASVLAVQEGWKGLLNPTATWAIGTLVSTAATITFATPRVTTKAPRWDRAEGILKREMESQIKSNSTIVPDPLDYRNYET